MAIILFAVISYGMLELVIYTKPFVSWFLNVVFPHIIFYVVIASIGAVVLVAAKFSPKAQIKIKAEYTAIWTLLASSILYCLFAYFDTKAVEIFGSDGMLDFTFSVLILMAILVAYMLLAEDYESRRSKSMVNSADHSAHT